MKVKRILSLMGAAALVGLLLTGCEKTGDAPVDSSAKKEEARTDVPVEMEDIIVWSDNAHEKDVREKQIEEFNNTVGKEEGIHIVYQVYGQNYADTIKIAAQAGEAPDLFRSDPAWMHDFVESGYVLPLEEMPHGVELIERYKDYTLNEYHIFRGKTYTLPYGATSFKFVVNTDLFEAAGLEVPVDWTWGDVRECARILTEAGKGDTYGYGLALKSLWTLSYSVFVPNGANVGYVGYDYNNRQFNFKAFKPAVEAVYQMAKDGSIFPGYEGLDADALRAQFSEGKIGILPAASFDPAVFNEQFPAKCNWEVVNIPAFEQGDYPYKEFVQTSQLLCIGEKAKEHQEKVMKVFEFFYSDACAAELYENGLLIPIRHEAVELATKEPSQKGFAAFAASTEKFIQPQMPQITNVLEGDDHTTTVGNLFAGTAGDDIDALLENLDERYNKALSTLSEEEIAVYDLPDGVTPEKGK